MIQYVQTENLIICVMVYTIGFDSYVNKVNNKKCATQIYVIWINSHLCLHSLLVEYSSIRIAHLLIHTTSKVNGWSTKKGSKIGQPFYSTSFVCFSQFGVPSISTDGFSLLTISLFAPLFFPNRSFPIVQNKACSSHSSKTFVNC